jgi:hypothetical protein
MLVGGRISLEDDLKRFKVATEKYEKYVKQNETKPEAEFKQVYMSDLIFDLIENANEEPARSLILEEYESIDSNLKKENIDALIEEGYFPPYDKSGGAKTSESPPKNKLVIKNTKGYTARRPIVKVAASQRPLVKLTDSQIFELEQSNLLAGQSASAFFKIMFPNISVGKMGQLRRARYAWDQPNAEFQCKVVLGSKGNKNCYICGVEFNHEPNELRRVCEHILPPLQAAMFLKLYKKGDNPNLHELQLEYAWAHICCNEIKTDNSFLAIERTAVDKLSFKRNDAYIQTLLNNVVKPGGQCKNAIQPTNVESWKEVRTGAINEKIDPIVQHINSKGDGRATLIAGFHNCVRNENLTSSFINLLKRYATLKEMIIINQQLLEENENLIEAMKQMLESRHEGGLRKRTKRNLRLNS